MPLHIFILVVVHVYRPRLFSDSRSIRYTEVDSRSTSENACFVVYQFKANVMKTETRNYNLG